MLAATINYLAPAEPFRSSRAERRAVGHPSTIRDVESAPHDVVVHDLSASGCSFAAAAGFPVGAVIRVGLAGAGATEARIVWQRDSCYGCAFIEPLSPRQLADAFGTAEPIARLPAIPDLRDDRAGAILPDHPLWPGPVRVVIHVGLASAAWAAFVVVARLIG